MVTVDLSVVITQDKKKVYEFLKNIEGFPKFMKDIKKLEVIERKNNSLITSWEVSIDGVEIFWKEENIFDDDKMVMYFRMLEGDYEIYEGIWKLEKTQKGTRLSVQTNFDWGLASFEKFVGHILRRKARKSLKGMLLGIKNKLEEGKL